MQSFDKRTRANYQDYEQMFALTRPASRVDRRLWRGRSSAVGQCADAAMAGDEAEAVAGDPQVQALTQGRHPRQVQKRRQRPEERQTPGHPAERGEAVIHPSTVRSDQVHLLQEAVRVERRLAGRQLAVLPDV